MNFKTKKNLIIILSLIVLLVVVLLINQKKPVTEKVLTEQLTYDDSQFEVVDGSGHAKLKIIVYENYLDKFSFQLLNTLEQAKSEFGNDLLFIYRPLVASNERSDLEAAWLMICANQQLDDALIVRDWLFSQRENNFSLDKVGQYAQKLNLNEKNLMDCINSSNQRSAFSAWQADIKESYIYGTPTILINDEIIIGARPYEDIVDSNDDEIEGLRSVIVRNLEKN